MPKISTVLNLAADKYLWDGGGPRNGDNLFSCWAIDDAVDSYCLSSMVRYMLVNRINEGLETLGLDTCSMKQFSEFEDIEERQGARYLWLKTAAMLAEEQGV